MTTTNRPSIDALDFEALTQLGDEVETRRKQLMEEYMSRGEKMGIQCTINGQKKRGKRKVHKEAD